MLKRFYFRLWCCWNGYCSKHGVPLVTSAYWYTLVCRQCSEERWARKNAKYTKREKRVQEQARAYREKGWLK